MDIYTLNKATGIQDEIKSLKEEKDIWESATSFCARTEVWNGTHRWVIRTSLIDFVELKKQNSCIYQFSNRSIGKRI